MNAPRGIFWCPGNWPGRLALIARPRGHDWLLEDLSTYRELGLNVIVSLLRENEMSELGLGEEAACAIERELDFVNFPVDDYGVPESMSNIFQLTDHLHRRLMRGETVGIHCRQSVGRSSLVAACLYVLSGTSPESAFEQIQQSRGVRVPDTVQQRQFVEAFAEAHCTLR